VFIIVSFLTPFCQLAEKVGMGFSYLSPCGGIRRGLGISTQLFFAQLSSPFSAN
jgi:hypothetical protein